MQASTQHQQQKLGKECYCETIMMQLATHKSGSPYGSIVKFNIFYPNVFYLDAKTYLISNKGILKILLRFKIGYKFSDLHILGYAFH
jgi:hypothetical protein